MTWHGPNPEHAERMRKLHADPVWRAKWEASQPARRKLRLGIPRYKPTDKERLLYAKLRRNGISRYEAVREAYGGVD